MNIAVHFMDVDGVDVEVQWTLLENVLNWKQLTTLAIRISLIDVSRLEMLSQDAMTCTKLKQLVEGMARHATHERFQRIRSQHSFCFIFLFITIWSIAGFP